MNAAIKDYAKMLQADGIVTLTMDDPGASANTAGTLLTGARRLRVGLVTPGFSASEADWCIPAQLDLLGDLVDRDAHRVQRLERRPQLVVTSATGSLRTHRVFCSASVCMPTRPGGLRSM